jgi:hypothetical protein
MQYLYKHMLGTFLAQLDKLFYVLDDNQNKEVAHK